MIGIGDFANYYIAAGISVGETIVKRKHLQFDRFVRVKHEIISSQPSFNNVFSTPHYGFLLNLFRVYMLGNLGTANHAKKRRSLILIIKHKPLGLGAFIILLIETTNTRDCIQTFIAERI